MFASGIQQELDTIDDLPLRQFCSQFLERNRKDGLRVDEHWDEKRRLDAGFFQSLFGKDDPGPGLSRVQSKYGGIPYLEDADDWPRSDGEEATFVGQLNFDEADSPEGFVDRGILVVFTAPPSPKADRPAPGGVFRVRWYPEATPERAADLQWPVRSVKYEVPLELTRADSFEIPSDLSEEVPDEIAGRDGELWEALAPLSAAIFESAANIGADLPFRLFDTPAPRMWSHPPEKDTDRLVQLWTPMDGHFGSLSATLMISFDDFEAGQLERCRTLYWQ